MAEKFPVTQAIRLLRQNKAEFRDYLYEYEERGGTAVAARELRLDEHAVIKTLVFEDESKRPLIVLMHGDCEVSQKNLARQLGVKTIVPCSPEQALKHTGYMVGGTSPFGTRKPLPVYVEQGILELQEIYINGGKRGYLVAVSPETLCRILKCIPVKVIAGQGEQ